MTEIDEAVETAQLAGDILKLMRVPQFSLDALNVYISERRDEDVAKALLFLLHEADLALEREGDAFRRLHGLGRRFGKPYGWTVRELAELAADATDTEILELADILLEDRFPLNQMESALAEALLCGLGYSAGRGSGTVAAQDVAVTITGSRKILANKVCPRFERPA